MSTKFLVTLGATLAIVMGLFTTLAIEIAGDNFLSDYLLPIILLIVAANIVSGVIVVNKGVIGVQGAIWRISLVVTVCVYVYFVVGTLYQAWR